MVYIYIYIYIHSYILLPSGCGYALWIYSLSTLENTDEINFFCLFTTSILGKLSTWCCEHSGDISCSLLGKPEPHWWFLGRTKHVFVSWIYIYIYIYIYMYIVEYKVCSVTSEPTQSSSRRVSSLKDSSVLLTTKWWTSQKWSPSNC